MSLLSMSIYLVFILPSKLREQERVKAEMEAQYVHRGEVLANSKEGVV